MPTVADVAASFQEAVLEVVVAKAMDAMRARPGLPLALAGGVAANTRLRELLGEACAREGVALYAPSPVLCTDNAAMIGCAAYYNYKAGLVDSLELDAFANLPFRTDPER